MLETKIETALRKGVEARGGLCLKWTCPNRRGVPDRIVFTPSNRIIFIETKAPDGRLKSWQRRQHALLRNYGCSVTALNNLDDVAYFLAGL